MRLSVLQTTYLAGGLISDSLLVKNNRGVGAEYKARRTAVEDLIRLHWWLDRSDDRDQEVAEFDKQRDVMGEHHGQ